MLVEKKPKGWYESSGCEIQRRVEKGFSFTEYCLPQHSSCAHGSAFSFAIFAGFECFGYKKVKLYIFAKKMNISAYFPKKTETLKGYFIRKLFTSTSLICRVKVSGILLAPQTRHR